MLADQWPQRAEALLQQRHVGLAVPEHGDAGGLHESGCAGDVVLGEHRQGGFEARRCRDPAEPPAGHGPGLGEGVDRDDQVVGFDVAQGIGGVRLAVTEARVGVVGDEPDAVAPAVLDDGVQFLGADRPARGVAGTVQEQQPGVGRDVVHEPLDVECPATAGRAQGVLHHEGAADAQRLADVGPGRAENHGAVARIDQCLGDQGEGLHPRGGHRDAAGVDLEAVDAPVIGTDLLAQLRLAAVRLVEVVPVGQRLPSGFGGDIRAGPAAFAEPERDDVVPADARIGDVADEARRQVRRPPAGDAARGEFEGGRSPVRARLRRRYPGAANLPEFLGERHRQRS